MPRDASATVSIDSVRAIGNVGAPARGMKSGESLIGRTDLRDLDECFSQRKRRLRGRVAVHPDRQRHRRRGGGGRLDLRPSDSQRVRSKPGERVVGAFVRSSTVSSAVSVEGPTDTRCSYPRAAAMSTGADLAARCVWARLHDARAGPGHSQEQRSSGIQAAELLNSEVGVDGCPVGRVSLRRQAPGGRLVERN